MTLLLCLVALKSYLAIDWSIWILAPRRLFWFRLKPKKQKIKFGTVTTYVLVSGRGSLLIVGIPGSWLFLPNSSCAATFASSSQLRSRWRNARLPRWTCSGFTTTAQFFQFAFFKKSLLCLNGNSMVPCADSLYSFFPPSNSLVLVSNSWHAFRADIADSQPCLVCCLWNSWDTRTL